MYDRSPTAANRPLSEEDVNSLLEQPKALAKDPDFLSQVLRRVLVTIRVRAREVSDLKRSIEHMNETRTSSQHPVEKGLAAIRTLSEVDREQVLGVYLNEKVALAEKAEQDALRAQTGTRSELNRVRFALAKLTDDPNIDPATKDKIRGALGSLTSRSAGERVEEVRETRVAPAPMVPPPAPAAMKIPEGFLAPPRPTPAQEEDLSHLFDVPH